MMMSCKDFLKSYVLSWQQQVHSDNKTVEKHYRYTVKSMYIMQKMDVGNKIQKYTKTKLVRQNKTVKYRWKWNKDKTKQQADAGV